MTLFTTTRLPLLYPDRKFRAADHVVENVGLADCAALVAEHHYAAGGSNTATFRHGLRHVDWIGLLGAAWWIPPTRSAAEARFPEGDWRRVLVLSRLVVVPEVPTNAASFLIGRSVRAIRKSGKWDCLLTYADEWQGHTGTIYRATNWEYLGLTAAESTWVTPEGQMVARKAGPKTRTIAEMESLGYRRVGKFRRHAFRKVFA